LIDSLQKLSHFSKLGILYSSDEIGSVKQMEGYFLPMGGQNWTPIWGQFSMPIDSERPGAVSDVFARKSGGDRELCMVAFGMQE